MNFGQWLENSEEEHWMIGLFGKQFTTVDGRKVDSETIIPKLEKSGITEDENQLIHALIQYVPYPQWKAFFGKNNTKDRLEFLRDNNVNLKMPEFRHFSNLVSLLPSLNPDEDRFSRHEADVENSGEGASSIVTRINIMKGDPQFLRELQFPGLKVSEKSLGYLDSLNNLYKPFLDATNKVQDKYYGASGAGIDGGQKLSDIDDPDIKKFFGLKYDPSYYIKSKWYVTEISRDLLKDNYESNELISKQESPIDNKVSLTDEINRFHKLECN